MSYPRSVLFTTVLLAIASTNPTTGLANVAVDEHTKYYIVKGKTGAEIYRNMQKHGPKHPLLNRSYLAISRTRIVPQNVKVRQHNGRCRISSMILTVKVVYELPKWKKTQTASKTTATAWGNFITTMQWHEKQHTKISINHAKSLEKKFRGLSLGPKKRCAAISFELERRIQRYEGKHAQLQLAFDRRDYAKGGRGYTAQYQLRHAK